MTVKDQKTHLWKKKLALPLVTRVQETPRGWIFKAKRHRFQTVIERGWGKGGENKLKEEAGNRVVIRCAVWSRSQRWRWKSRKTNSDKTLFHPLHWLEMFHDGFQGKRDSIVRLAHEPFETLDVTYLYSVISLLLLIFFGAGSYMGGETEKWRSRNWLFSWDSESLGPLNFLLRVLLSAVEFYVEERRMFVDGCRI